MDGREMAIREAGPGDSVLLDALVTQTLGECLGDALPRGELEACTHAYLGRHAHEKCYVAESEGTLAGYAIVAEDRVSPCGGLRRLYVRRTAESGDDDRGVAAALVEAACTDREVPITSARADSRETALELYDRWGFIDVEALQRCLSSPSGLGRLVR